MLRRYLLTLFRAMIHDKTRAALAGYIGPNPRPLVRLRRGTSDVVLEGVNRIGEIKQDIQRTSEVLSRPL